MNAPALQREIEAFLAAYHVMSLATLADDGGPHAASLFYAPDGLGLVWTSDPAARHSQYLAARPAVAATVAPDTSDFRSVHGVQITGAARRLPPGAEADRASRLMRSRYPFLNQLAGGPLALRAAFDKAGFYRLDPERLTLIDNAKGFGHKDTLRVLVGGAVALDGAS